MSKTAYFLLKTSIREDYDIADAARDVEQMAEAVCKKAFEDCIHEEAIHCRSSL